jgi:hypothetical protein
MIETCPKCLKVKCEGQNIDCLSLGCCICVEDKK